MALAVKKTFEAMPQPGFVIAVGEMPATAES
jgi:Ni,Fe-hydrogenase III small subunit